VNRPIVRLYGLIAVMFALLVAFTSRWTVFDASSLRENPLNARRVLEQERIARGEITAANGAVLARSVRGPEGAYERVYPTGELFAAPVGYDYIDLNRGNAGLERYRNKELNGQSASNLEGLLEQLQGKEPQGEKVITTLDPRAQRELRGLIRALASEGHAIVLSTHLIETAESLCDRAVILNAGRCVANGALGELRGPLAARSLEDAFLEITA